MAWMLVGALAGLASTANGAEISGKDVFDQYCAQCHEPGDAPGTVHLTRTRGKEKGLLTQRTDLAPEYVEYVVRHGLKSMPPFVPSDLTDAKLKALVGFLAKREKGGK
jgi:mono/diheme cytochrome c family protein